jgi:hypothetical protein
LKTSTKQGWGAMLCFQKYFRQNTGEKMAFFTQNKAKLCKNLIITLVLAESCDHIIDPGS